MTKRAAQTWALTFCEALQAQVAEGLVVQGTVLCPHLVIHACVSGDLRAAPAAAA